MRVCLLVFSLILWSFGLWAVSIYDIQYTTVPGIDNTYPSKYSGKLVTLEGIVTFRNPEIGGFYISEPIAGPWRGILILDKHINASIGDKVLLQGYVKEIFGMTCLQNLLACKILDTNRSLPVPVSVTTGQLVRSSEAESYEGVLVRIQNATCSNIHASSRFNVNDGTDACAIDLKSISSASKPFSVHQGDYFTSITGIVNYSYGEYSVSPRFNSDIIYMAPTYNFNRSWGRIKSIYK